MRRITIPAFKAHLSPVALDGEGALLLSETGAHILSGNVYAVVVPLVDGRRSANEIVDAAAPALDAASAWYALMQLEAAGYLTDARPALDPSEAAFWSGLGLDETAALATLNAASVRVHAVGAPAAAATLRTALRRCGIKVLPEVRTSADADLQVVLTGDYLDDALLPLDEAARASRQRWLLVRPAGLELWTGPLFEPDGTPCLHCLRYRLGGHRVAHQYAARFGSPRAVTPPAPSTPVAAAAACMLAALEVSKVLTGVEPGLGGRVVSLDLRNRSIRTHRLVRNPCCDACGDRREIATGPLHLRSRVAAVNTGSGWRTSTPDATLQRYDHLVSPITGIVNSLIPDEEECVQLVGRTYTAVDWVWTRPTRLSQLKSVFRHSSAGKGTTDTQARASALCEAIERYSARRQGSEPARVGTLRELAADAIHPNDVMRFSDRQYRERDAWNEVQPAVHFVPEPFDPDARIEWTPIWSLTEQRHRLLPTDLLFMSQRRSPCYSVGCSNGCAAGNNLEEAVLQGFYEVVERDAVAIWWYNRLAMPAVELAAFDDDWLATVPAHLGALGREVTALDLTHDLGIPVIAALSYLREASQERIVLGLGCHLDPCTAARRAVLEMCQMLAADAAGRMAADDNVWGIDSWLANATRDGQPYLVADGTVPKRTPADFGAAPGADLLEAIEAGQHAVEAQGLEMLVLDQTRPDAAMPAVKVVVPGMRHFWARFAPGRLYEVPVKMGWIDQSRAEADLNPIPFFL